MTFAPEGGTEQLELVSRALGRQVISGDDATTIGKIKAMLLDHGATRIEALHVAGRSKNAEVLAWADVGGFGPDAVVMRAGATLVPVADETQEAMVRHRITLLDAKVLGTDGFERGKVADIAFDPASGALRSLAVNGVNVPASCIRSLGPYCWVVDASVPFS